MKLEFIHQVAALNSEDGGDAKILAFTDDESVLLDGDLCGEENPPHQNESVGIWVRLTSWDPRRNEENQRPEDHHLLAEGLVGKRIKITIETLEDEADE